ncbi:HK97 family phage prohead protease [Lutibacter sp. Hel_I_33_5]|uniref:HK97 family phage prohead protease n=1 Tax=Lutibacter sp. Hel_I_33_5 TaxID=1566289 RepID=UPI0011A4D17A|nr:HK97 family phage prohead protease [Lutibacter sp. Hel_I_33_5]TVZ55606.1 HK97 family phage prohead protease [Lutibacter sp. Hel_I_33_5]
MNKQDINKVVVRDAFVRETTAEMIENRQVDFVISSEAIDSYGTVFKMDGWDLKRYLQNPVVCYQHRSSTDNPDDLIGVSTLRIEDGKLIGRVTFEEADVNPKADKIFRKVQNGTLKMASVGARILDAHYGDEKAGENADVLYFDRAELVEWSVVSVGANPEAHKRNAQTLEEIRTALVVDVSVVEQEEIKVNENRSVEEAQIVINKNRI